MAELKDYLKIPPTDYQKYQYILSRPRYTHICGAMDFYTYEHKTDFENCVAWFTIYKFTWYITSLRDAMRQFEHARTLFDERLEARCQLWCCDAVDFYDSITFTLYSNF